MGHSSEYNPNALLFLCNITVYYLETISQESITLSISKKRGSIF